MEYRVSSAQLDELLDFLEERPNLARSVGLGPKSKEMVDKQWDDLAQKLNGHGKGATKTGQRWKRYWADLKHKNKARVSARRRDASYTTHQPPALDDLSVIDKRILSILGNGTVYGNREHKVTVFENEPEIDTLQEAVIDQITGTKVEEPEESTGVEKKYLPNSPTLRRQTDSPSSSTSSHPQSRHTRFSRSQQHKSPTEINITWVADLETRRVDAEEKLANAALIMAEAAKTQAEAAKTQAEASKIQAQALQAQSAILNKLVDILKK